MATKIKLTDNEKKGITDDNLSQVKDNDDKEPEEDDMVELGTQLEISVESMA